MNERMRKTMCKTISLQCAMDNNISWWQTLINISLPRFICPLHGCTLSHAQHTPIADNVTQENGTRARCARVWARCAYHLITDINLYPGDILIYIFSSLFLVCTQFFLRFRSSRCARLRTVHSYSLTDGMHMENCSPHLLNFWTVRQERSEKKKRNRGKHAAKTENGFE